MRTDSALFILVFVDRHASRDTEQAQFFRHSREYAGVENGEMPRTCLGSPRGLDLMR